ncbi:MAG: hypothetical protein K2M87_04785 [Muribaculaceae bacterium]|nr:hypothetical protein [Muribaculaceae bacterium]
MKRLLTYRTVCLTVVILLCIIVISCVGNHSQSDTEGTQATPAPWDLVAEGEDPPISAPEQADEWELAMSDLASDSTAINDSTKLASSATDSISDTPTVAANLTRYGRIGRLREVFNDSNKYQYAAGERIGIRPIATIADAYYVSRPLVKIESNKWYDVDELTHSMPYLVPEAARLLETIGRNFQDSLQRRGAAGHKFRVTSVLRSAYSVKRLRRVNRNATDSSTHQLATTFDISYAKFNHDGLSPRHSDEELKYILAEVLRDLRHQGRCMVKFEVHSPCFHITATGK